MDTSFEQYKHLVSGSRTVFAMGKELRLVMVERHELCCNADVVAD
jgi:hypothetical protein